MPEAEHNRHERPAEPRCRPRTLLPSLEPEHATGSLSKPDRFGPGRRGASRFIASPRPRTTTALTAGSARTGTVEGHAAKVLRAAGDESDRGDRGGKPNAEGENEDEPIADPLQRDRREQNDQRGRAGDDARGDPYSEQSRPSAAALPVAVRVPPVVVVVAVMMRVVVVVGRWPSGSPRRQTRIRQRRIVTPTATTSRAETRLSQG